LLDQLFLVLVQLECDLVGVMYTAGGQCSAVCRRTKPRSKVKIPEVLDIKFDEIYALRIVGKAVDTGLALTYELLQLWGNTGGRVTVNFKLMEQKLWTKEDVLLAWGPLTADEIMLDILGAEEKILLKRPHTERDSYVKAMGRKLLIYISGLREASASCVEFIDGVDGTENIPFDVLDNLELVYCRSFDVVTGAPIEYPLLDWLRQGFWRSHTLVLHGDAGLGKTPLAMSLLAEIAAILQRGAPWRAYYIKVGTVEGLRDAASGGLMKAKIPVLFDDLSPDKACGTRSGMPIEGLKLLTEVTQSSSVHARFKDLNFSVDQPRIFTSNAMSPNGWHNGLPMDPWSVSDAVRCSYDSHVKAVFKRCVFAFVPQSLVSPAVRAAHQAARRAA
jgi:hypothetical protein